ncbi:MAG: TonB-dependent receptor plug domain-containing protein, partial [Rhodospirillaceae bacterium]
MGAKGQGAAGAACVILFAAVLSGGAARAAEQLADLDAMSIEELGNIEVTSVSKRGESVRHAAAAIYVITAEDIRRSGATTIPEMLRLAPNLQVSRINASKYSITARGFATDSPNKLLVLIDGRSVYSPLHAAVFWDAQDVPPQDIERIEVISGPGGTLWGANAVNGVINIITKSASETLGAFASAGVGNEERDISA